MNITLPELEQAINYWRNLRPASGDDCVLSPEVNTLAIVYALMIFNRQASIAASDLAPSELQLLKSWRERA